MKPSPQPADEDLVSLPRRPAPHPLAGTIAIGVSVAVLVYVIAYAAVPSARPRLAIEDGIIETTTALVFLGAAAVGAVALTISRRRGGYWLIPLIGLLGFLDEMRFGGRLFGYALPSLDGREMDSFHDLLEAAAGFLGVNRIHLLVAGAAAGLAIVGILLTGGRLRRLPAWAATHRPAALMSGALLMVAVGFGFDQLGSTPAALFAEESAEFVAAGLVAVAAADLLTPTPPAGSLT